MSSSPDPVTRSGRVIRGPGSLLPLASLVTPRSQFPSANGKEPATSLEALLDAARGEAFEEGRQAALAEAAAGAEARRAAMVAETATELRRAAAGLATLRAGVVDEVVGDALDLAFELVGVLLGRELELSEAPVRDAVARALALVPDGHDLVVRVHPDCGLEDRDIAELAADRGVQVVRDPAVDQHGCEVTIGACRIDAQIPAALERVRHCLDEVRPSSVRPRSGKESVAVGTMAEAAGTMAEAAGR